MTDGDDGIPEAGTAGDPAALTRQTAPSPLPGAPGRAWPRPGRTGFRTEIADTVDVPEPGVVPVPWRAPGPGRRLSPQPARADLPSSTLTRDASPVVERPTIGWRAIVVRRGPSFIPCARAAATFRSPAGGSDTDYAVDATPTHERDSARRSWGYSRVLASVAKAGFRS